MCPQSEVYKKSVATSVLAPENGRIPEKHALSTGASREAPVDNARLTLGT